MKTKHLLALGLVLPLIAGCSTSGSKYMIGNPQIVAEPDKISAMLADAADRASTSLEELAAIEAQKRKVAASPNLDDAPVELMRGITVNWIGPVEPLLKKLSDHASYNFKVYGSGPAVPLVVSVDAENQPIVEVLRGVGTQLGSEAAVHVDAQDRSVELRYVTKFQDIDDL
ncbi:MAG: DotD/TraH family lipoprotein [Rhodospirillales bacterium]|nr:DotD/TraH family lipoprotein [Rhodospirillales bacterium]MCB9965577.1 DotD/TraH family lipoprotein [Rhodospirillales bacterium]MCB9979818.1 DotD/TraH family lipoprotein [Rhodospirillales bacterium]